MENTGAATNSAQNLNVHSMAAFIPTFDGSFPVQDFIQEIEDAAKLGSWTDNLTLKVAKSKIQGPIADMVRNRNDLNHADSFKDFSKIFISALHTDRPVSIRLQELMTCAQLPSESVDAFATKIRQKSKSLTEWDATVETKELKNRTVTAAFLKGLQPNIRQLVMPAHPSDFEAAIALARTHELHQTLMPSGQLSASSVETPQNSSESAMLALQNRVASLELSAAQTPSTRGRGQTPTRGRGRGRQPHRQNFPNQPRFRQNRSWTGPPPQSYGSFRYSSFDSNHAPDSGNYRSYSCPCCCDDNRRHGSPSRQYYHDRRHSRSPSRHRSYRSASRSPDRDHRRRSRYSRTPSASPVRQRHQSPNGYRSRY